MSGFCHKKRQIISLAAVTLTAFALRLLIAWPGIGNTPEHFSRPDSPGYLGPAMALAADGCFNTNPGSNIPSISRAPGFPFFLAALFKFFNVNMIMPVVAMCLLGALICVPVYLTGRLFAGPTAGLLAAIFIAFNITAIAMSPMYLSDTLFTFTVAWQLYFFSAFFRRKSLTDLNAAAALAGLAVLIRPIGLLWVIPAVFLILICPRLEWRKKLSGSLWFIIIFYGIIMPWMCRNAALGAGFCIDTNTGSMYHQNGAMLLSAVKGSSYEQEKQRLLRETEAELANFRKYPDEKSKVDYRLAKLRELVRQYPLTYLRLHLQPSIMLPDAPTFCELLGYTTNGRGTLDVMHRYGIFAAVKHYFQGNFMLLALLSPLLLLTAAIYAGCMLQFLRWIWGGKVFLFFFFLAFVEYYLLLPGPITVPRYHLPGLPLIAVMAAIAATWLLKLWKRPRTANHFSREISLPPS